MAMEEMRNPSLLRDTTEEGKKFREGLLRVNGQLLELIARRNASAIHVANEGRRTAVGSDDPIKTEKEAEKQASKESQQEDGRRVSVSILGLTALKFRRPSLKGFWNQLRRIDKPSEGQFQSEGLTESIFSGIGEASKKYFAKDRQVISSLEKEVQRLEAQITDLTMEIESIRKGTATYIRERVEAIEALETARLELMDRFAHAHKDQQKKLDDLEDRFARYRYHLQDGFNLGVWFRENNIEPSPNFYGSHKA